MNRFIRKLQGSIFYSNPWTGWVQEKSVVRHFRGPRLSLPFWENWMKTYRFRYLQNINHYVEFHYNLVEIAPYSASSTQLIVESSRNSSLDCACGLSDTPTDRLARRFQWLHFFHSNRLICQVLAKSVARIFYFWKILKFLLLSVPPPLIEFRVLSVHTVDLSIEFHDNLIKITSNISQLKRIENRKFGKISFAGRVFTTNTPVDWHENLKNSMFHNDSSISWVSVKWV